jgi:hypothetical protein
MVKIILVNRNASLTEKSVKNFELSTLYKKCSLKSESNFEKRHTWNVDGFFYSVYAKDNGRSNSENKYDLPPPVDEELYFNTMAIIKHTETDATNGTVTDLIMSDWDKVYEKLFGGFEDLDHSEELSEDDEEISESEKTKEGYHKDGFVVDDDDEDDEDYVPEEDDLEESDSYNDSDEEDSEELDSEELEGDSEDEGKESEDEGKESEEEYYSELSEDSYCSSEED